MEIITEIALLKSIDAFLERHKMAPTTFGRKATGEPQLIDSIRKGRSPSLKVTNRVLDFMREYDATSAPPPLELTAPPGEEEIALPFGTAPVNLTGASSPTFSPTAGPPERRAESESSRSSGSDEELTL